MKTKNDDSNISGLLGNSLTVLKRAGKVVVNNRPKRQGGDPTGKQEAFRTRFEEGVNYAKDQIADPASNAIYKTGVTAKMRSTFIVALTDYLTPPQVTSIDTNFYKGLVGDLIKVHANDDFMVTRVNVVITDATGAVIEQGDATGKMTGTGVWSYKATVANSSLPGTSIKAIAYDRPENIGKLEVKL